MPRGSKVASKKKPVTESVHERDRIIVRLPDGMRDRLSAFAESNGRSMTAEVVAAIDQHLKGKDRITELWEAFEKHRENIEAIPHIWTAVEDLENQVAHVTGDDSISGYLTKWGQENAERARLAAMPPITAEQVAHIRELITQTGAPEKEILNRLTASTIAEIKEYGKAISEIANYVYRRTGVYPAWGYPNRAASQTS